MMHMEILYIIIAVPLTKNRHTGLDLVSSKSLKNMDSGSAKTLSGTMGLFFLLSCLPCFYVSIWLLLIRLLAEFTES